MLELFLNLLTTLRSALCTRTKLALENLALRQQVAVLASACIRQGNRMDRPQSGTWTCSTALPNQRVIGRRAWW